MASGFNEGETVLATDNSGQALDANSGLHPRCAANGDAAYLDRRERETAESYAKLGLPPESLPRHVAVIMDGNGRWAQARGKHRMYGHSEGAKGVRPIVTECARLKLDVLTLYSFSMENWKRPDDEIDFLMDLFEEYLIAEREQMMGNDVRFIQVGRRKGLSERLLAEMDKTIEMTAANKGLTLALAINYGSRTEITDAVRSIAERVRRGELDPEQITQQTVSDSLYTAHLPDPDLLVRTAGEQRVSNYLLWQISYAEIYVADVCWPDFDVEQLHTALRAYASRRRNFGAVPQQAGL